MWSLGLGQARETVMIGRFAFCEVPQDDQVAVEIGCGTEGQRLGRIRLAARLQLAVEANPDYPSLEIMPIEAAFSYGIFLALKLCASLVITGDPSAWNPRWGHLLELRGASTVPWLGGRFG